MTTDLALGGISSPSVTSTTNSQATAAAATITGTSASAAAQTTQAGQQELSSNFSQFLTLLTTQLQNQDPLNPMDSTQFTQQLVEYSQVEQQLDTNSKLDNLTSLSMNSTMSLALGYVGKDITYTSSDMNWDGSTPITVDYNLASTAASATMNITDSSGDVVYTAPVSGASGTTSTTWNGVESDGSTAPAGTYSVNIAALDSTGNAVTSTTAVTGLVRGVESQDGTPTLLVGDRSVAISNVIDVADPGSSTATASGASDFNSTGTNSDTNTSS